MVEPVSAIIGLVDAWWPADDRDPWIHREMERLSSAEALKHPAGRGIFSLEGKRNEFLPVIDGMTDVFNGIRKLVERYDGLDSTKLVTVFWKKGKWAVTGMDEAQRLAVELSQQKQALQFTLSVAYGGKLDTIIARISDNSLERSAIKDEISLVSKELANANQGISGASQGIQGLHLQMNEVNAGLNSVNIGISENKDGITGVSQQLSGLKLDIGQMFNEFVQNLAGLKSGGITDTRVENWLDSVNHYASDYAGSVLDGDAETLWSPKKRDFNASSGDTDSSSDESVSSARSSSPVQDFLNESSSKMVCWRRGSIQSQKLH